MPTAASSVQRRAISQAGRTTKVVYNCLPPGDWGDRLPVRCSFGHNYPRELQERVLANWKTYGFPDR